MQPCVALVMEDVLTLSDLRLISDKDLDDTILLDYICTPGGVPETKILKHGKFDFNELIEHLSHFRFKKQIDRRSYDGY